MRFCERGDRPPSTCARERERISPPPRPRPRYYDFNTLSYGIAHCLPLAEYLSGVMVDGEQPYDLSAECAPTRYGANWASDGFAAAKIAETYAHNNRVSYPHENRPAGRTDVYGDALSLIHI